MQLGTSRECATLIVDHATSGGMPNPEPLGLSVPVAVPVAVLAAVGADFAGEGRPPADGAPPAPEFESGAPREIRTPDRLLRRQLVSARSGPASGGAFSHRRWAPSIAPPSETWPPLPDRDLTASPANGAGFGLL